MSTVKPQLPKLKNYYFFGEKKPPLKYRVGTSDEDIINSILINRQEYFFPLANRFAPERIYDIGANIGILSVLFANLYPEVKEIHAFEPEPENFKLLRENTKSYPNIQVHHCGLGAQTGMKKLYPSDNPKNFGGFSNFIESGEPVDCKILSVKRAVELYGVPDLIKIDVEGAESEILRNFPHLERVSYIAGELHSQDAEYLMLHVLSAHFRLSHRRDFFDKTWHFHAANKSWEDFGRVAPQPTPENGLDAPKEGAQTGDSKPT